MTRFEVLCYSLETCNKEWVGDELLVLSCNLGGVKLVPITLTASQDKAVYVVCLKLFPVPVTNAKDLTVGNELL